MYKKTRSKDPLQVAKEKSYQDYIIQVQFLKDQFKLAENNIKVSKKVEENYFGKIHSIELKDTNIANKNSMISKLVNLFWQMYFAINGIRLKPL